MHKYVKITIFALLIKIQKMQKVYVMRAEDESCTKIGRSYNPDSRCESIVLTERKKYYLLYETHAMKNEEASKLELQIINKFKDFTIKGKEWFNIHPLEVIRFIHTLIKIPTEENNSVFGYVDYKFDRWLDKNTMYKNAEFFNDYIKVGKTSYIAYIKLLHNCKFITVAFSNIGDAIKFTKKNKNKIEAKKIATNFIYGLDFEEWKNTQHNLKHLSEWRLI